MGNKEKKPPRRKGKPKTVSAVATSQYEVLKGVSASATVQWESVNPGYDFERQVAAIFRTLGAKVTHQTALAGNQIDILLEERTPSGTAVRTAVECKSYSRPVGIDVINSFAGLSYLLKQRGVIDRAVIVSAQGFTARAREAAKEHNVELVEINDLKIQVQGQEDAVAKAERDIEAEFKESVKSPSRVKRVFALMPFTPEFDDVYILGIREVGEKLGLSVERADDIEHNEGILEVIQERIVSSDVVVADTSFQNPNVFYEVGFAHALRKPTILITHAGQEIPFDLRGMNHIFYKTLVDLREKLERRLQATLNDLGSP